MTYKEFIAKIEAEEDGAHMIPVRIITACSQGLCRSVGLADVLKLHFEPVDVIPIGLNSNHPTTVVTLGAWCDHFIIMTESLRKRIPTGWFDLGKVMVCEVGQDTYKNPKNPLLIDKVWRWTRYNADQLGIIEHNRKI